MVDMEVARSGDRRGAELRHGDGEFGASVRSEAEQRKAVMFLRVDDQLVALDHDDGAVEQLLAARRRHPGIGAGADGHVIGAGDLDLLEVPDLVVARHGRAAPVVVRAARARRGGSGNQGRGDGLAHLVSPVGALS
jgi:hypothetical protein